MPKTVVTKELALAVWSRLDDGENRPDIAEDLHLSERTVQRLGAAWSKLEAIRPNGEISLATG